VATPSLTRRFGVAAEISRERPPRRIADVAVAADPLSVLDNAMFCVHKGAAKAPALRGPLTAADAPAHTDRMQSVR